MKSTDEESLCPSQEDINEGICLKQAELTFERKVFSRIVKYQAWGYQAWHNRKVVVEASYNGIWRKLKAVGESLCFPRIFEVNDHGNVTEYSYTGKVVGEWV